MAEQVQARTKSHQFSYGLSVLTDVGKRRSENQDAYGYGVSSQSALFLVCDGMGGARGGATASALAVTHILRNAFHNGSVDAESLRIAIAGSNAVIYGRSQEDPNLFGMGTTVASVLVSENQVVVAHVGDSRVYLLREGQLTQLTRDHTLVQELVDTGTINESEAAHHPIAHMLTRSLGPTEIIGVEVKSLDFSLKGGERFLICSDGLYNHVGPDKVKELMSQGTPETITQSLITHALDGGGSDNVTALVVEISKEKSVSGLLEIPSDGVVQRVVSRELPAEELESINNFSHWTGNPGAAAKPASANGAHETTGFLKADEVFAYAKEHQERVAKGTETSGTASQDSSSTLGKPLAAALVVFGVLASAMYFGRGGSNPTDHHVSNLPSPTPTAAQLAMNKTPEPIPSSTVLPTSTPEPVDTSGLFANETPEEHAPQPTREPVLKETPVVVETPSNLIDVPTPKATEASSDILGPTVEPTAVPTSTLPLPSPTQTPTPTLEDVQQNLSSVPANGIEPKGIPAELIIQAFGMEIAAPQRLDEGELSRVPELSANSQIVWEHESQKMARVIAETRAKRVNETGESKDPNAPKPKIFSQTELANAAKEKDAARKRISEIDGKIRFLLIDEKPEAKKLGKEFDLRIGQLRQKISAKQKEISKWDQALKAWQFVREQSVSTDTVKLALTAEKFSPSIQAARVAYQNANDTYTSSLDRWKNQALDTKATALLAQLGREAKAKRLELENSVRNEVERGWLEAKEQLAQSKIELAGLEREKDLMVKYSGYSNGFAPVVGTSRVDLYRKYLSERAKQVRKIKELQSVLDDDSELAFRVQEASGEFPMTSDTDTFRR